MLSRIDTQIISLKSEFLLPVPQWKPYPTTRSYDKCKKYRPLSVSLVHSSPKIVRDRTLDKHVVKNNKIRFVHKLKTLLLSKPKHYMPLHVLSKCGSYLSLTKTNSLLSMIRRYPLIFELFTIPLPPTPLNATKLNPQLCVRLTQAAESLTTKEYHLRSTMSQNLGLKLQKLLMLSSHHRLLLSKLVHLGPDLGLPQNFRSKLCNNHPDKFKTVDTSYGRALELVSWDPHLANLLPSPDLTYGLIVDRPLKFKHLRLRKGMNIKRPHREYLINFGELPDVCPYRTSMGELTEGSIEAEKRACAVVREMLGMMVEKRTLVDHLTHFRKDFGLPNRLRGMLVRHPELFYVSLKGQRDSVFLVEGYDDKGTLLEKNETLVIKDQLMDLVREGKQMKRDRRKNRFNIDVHGDIFNAYGGIHNEGDVHEDGLDNLFDTDDFDDDDYSWDNNNHDSGDDEGDGYSYWKTGVNDITEGSGSRDLQPW